MERELVGKKRIENNSKNKNTPNSNNNNKSNAKSDSTAANKLNKKEINTQAENYEKKALNENQNKGGNIDLEKKYSFNSESDESDLINRLLERKQIKNSIIKNYNSNSNKFNWNSVNNKYNKSSYDHNQNNNGNNNFGIKFSDRSKNKIADSDEDEISENNDEEILPEDINSISEDVNIERQNNTDDFNPNKIKDRELNLSLNETLDKSRETYDINKISKSKRLEYSFDEEDKVDFKIKNDKRKLILNERVVSSDESERETAKPKNKRGLDLSKFHELLEEQEKLQASENNTDFIGFKAPYSSSVKNQFKTEASSDHIKNLFSKQNDQINNGKGVRKDITKVDFIGFSKPSTSDAQENPAPEQNEISIPESHGFSLHKPLFSQYPWITENTAEYKGLLKLHFEICDFYNYIKPLPSEHEIRKKSFAILKELIVGRFPNWRVKVFGSFPNEIFLSDSDVDIVVISREKKDNAKKTMDKLYDYLYLNSNLFDYIKRIDAKVPIIKLQLKETKINLDISVDRKNGYDAKRIIKKSLNDFHALKPLIYLLKYFMRQKKLNETFSGGISSFLLFNLVLAFLQYKSKTDNSPSLNLGQLLVDFFQFYGFEFNYDEIGISVRYGGFFYKRKDKDTARPSFLSIENFQDVSQNIGSGAYKFRKVLDCFKQARDALYYPSSYPINSYIGQFITTDSFLRNRFRFNHEE